MSPEKIVLTRRIGTSVVVVVAAVVEVAWLVVATTAGRVTGTKLVADELGEAEAPEHAATESIAAIKNAPIHAD